MTNSPNQELDTDRLADLLSEVGSVDHPGDLTERDPLRVILPPSGRGTSDMVTAHCWVMPRTTAAPVLVMEITAAAGPATGLDVEHFFEWARRYNATTLFGTLTPSSSVKGTTNVYTITVRHALPIDSVTTRPEAVV